MDYRVQELKSEKWGRKVRTSSSEEEEEEEPKLSEPPTSILWIAFEQVESTSVHVSNVRQHLFTVYSV